MHSLWKPDDRAALMQRLRSIRADDQPRWGCMSAPAMLAHLIATLRYALAEPETPSRKRRGFWRLPPVKYAFVYLVRFPRRAPAPPGFLAAADGTIDEQVASIAQLMEDVSRRAATSTAPLPEHPYFGRLTRHAWGVLGYKHADHHLRQFSR